jgi:hypothetical protein
MTNQDVQEIGVLDQLRNLDSDFDSDTIFSAKRLQHAEDEATRSAKILALLIEARKVTKPALSLDQNNTPSKIVQGDTTRLGVYGPVDAVLTATVYNGNKIIAKDIRPSDCSDSGLRVFRIDVPNHDFKNFAFKVVVKAKMPGHQIKSLTFESVAVPRTLKVEATVTSDHTHRAGEQCSFRVVSMAWARVTLTLTERKSGYVQVHTVEETQNSAQTITFTLPDHELGEIRHRDHSYLVNVKAERGDASGAVDARVLSVGPTYIRPTDRWLAELHQLCADNTHLNLVPQGYKFAYPASGLPSVVKLFAADVVIAGTSLVVVGENIAFPTDELISPPIRIKIDNDLAVAMTGEFYSGHPQFSSLNFELAYPIPLDWAGKVVTIDCAGTVLEIPVMPPVEVGVIEGMEGEPTA